MKSLFEILHTVRKKYWNFLFVSMNLMMIWKTMSVLSCRSVYFDIFALTFALRSNVDKLLGPGWWNFTCEFVADSYKKMTISINTWYMAQALYQYEFHNAKLHGTGTRHYINMNSIMPRYMTQALYTISLWIP